MKGLDQLLDAEEPVITEVQNNHHGLSHLDITNYALEKAQLYAHLTCEISGRDKMECGGYLVAPKDSPDRIAVDAYLARDQQVQEGWYEVSAKDVIRAGRELDQQGYRVLGWWHSHATMNVPFSAADDRGQMTVLNEIAAINYLTETREVRSDTLRVEKGKDSVVVYDIRNPGRRYEFELSRFNWFNPTAMRVTEEQRIGFAYGLVVYDIPKKDPYVEIAYRELCAHCQQSRDRSVIAGLTVVPTAEAYQLDQDLLRAEIKDRVHFPTKWKAVFKSFFGPRNYDLPPEELIIPGRDDRTVPRGGAIESFRVRDPLSDAYFEDPVGFPFSMERTKPLDERRERVAMAPPLEMVLDEPEPSTSPEVTAEVVPVEEVKEKSIVTAEVPALKGDEAKHGPG